MTLRKEGSIYYVKKNKGEGCKKHRKKGRRKEGNIRKRYEERKKEI